MTGAELHAISALLLEMAEEFEDHSANDWTVPATRENKAIVEAAIACNHRLGREGLDDPVQARDGEYFIWDDWLMRYLEERCNPGQPPLSNAELAVLGDLLEVIAEDSFNLLVEEERIAEAQYLAARCKGAPVAAAFAGPAAAPPQTVATSERPGVSERWMKQWPATLRNHDEWFESFWPDQHQEMADYVRTGKPRYYEPSQAQPPVAPWESLHFLSFWALLNLWKWERAGIEDGRWDGEAVASAFMASYLSAAADTYRAAMRPLRQPGSRASTDLDMPFAALGFVIGMRQRAELVSRLHLAAFRRGYFDPDMHHPVSAFMLKLLADYFSQEPIGLAGDPPTFAKGRIPAAPTMQKLLDVWRSPDPAVVAPRLIAACDIHTHQSVGGAASNVEFRSGHWTRTPIAVLLVLKLREHLGLANPQIDHPLTRTVVGRLPAGPGITTGNDMLMAVEMRMRKDGFDEKRILAAYGIV